MILDFPLRLLLVDDDLAIRTSLGQLLQAHGMFCHVACDGFEALRQLRRTPPDLIISDLGMPNMSGFEFLAIVRRRFPQIPVIVISGEFITDLSSSGLLMNKFLRKGAYTTAELLASIRELHGQHPILPKVEHAPLWINRLNNALIATCTECLRSFPVEDGAETVSGVHSEECPSCGTLVAYRVQYADCLAG